MSPLYNCHCRYMEVPKSIDLNILQSCLRVSVISSHVPLLFYFIFLTRYGRWTCSWWWKITICTINKEENQSVLLSAVIHLQLFFCSLLKQTWPHKWTNEYNWYAKQAKPSATYDALHFWLGRRDEHNMLAWNVWRFVGRSCVIGVCCEACIISLQHKARPCLHKPRTGCRNCMKQYMETYVCISETPGKHTSGGTFFNVYIRPTWVIHSHIQAHVNFKCSFD